MLLTGRRWDDLTICERLDVVEAILAEGTGVDTILNDLEEQIARVYPDRDRWGMTEQQQAAQAAAERLLGGTTDDGDAAPTMSADGPGDGTESRGAPPRVGEPGPE